MIPKDVTPSSETPAEPTGLPPGVPPLVDEKAMAAALGGRPIRPVMATTRGVNPAAPGVAVAPSGRRAVSTLEPDETRVKLRRRIAALRPLMADVVRAIGALEEQAPALLEALKPEAELALAAEGFDVGQAGKFLEAAAAAADVLAPKAEGKS